MRIRLILVFLLAATVSILNETTAYGASYQKTDGEIVDPIQSILGGDHDYAGVDLEPGSVPRFSSLDLAVLVDADLSGSDLVGSSFIGSDLSGANLASTRLEDVNFADANLGTSFMKAANLVRTNLIGASLSGADLTGASPDDATYDEFTLFPSGLDIYSGDWGLPGDATPWDLGMIPTPEPASGLMLGIGGLALAAMGRRR